MKKERNITTLQRVISLLLAIVLTVSGTGLTAFATDVEPETAVTETEETTDVEAAEETEETEEAAAPDEQTEEPSADDPVEEPSDDPVEEPSEEPDEEPTEEPSHDPVEEPSEEPDEEPTEEPSHDPVEEPSAEEPEDEPVEEPEIIDAGRFAVPLELEVKAEGRVTYTFATEDEAIWSDAAPAVRLWQDEEYDKYRDFTDTLDEHEQIVAAFVLWDGAEETPVAFAKTAEVFLSCLDWDWKALSKDEVRDTYTLYLADDKGELEPVEFDVLREADRDNDRGNALSFATKALSYVVLTEKVSVSAEADVKEYNHLVEVPASEDESLLSDERLAGIVGHTAQGGKKAPRRVAPDYQEPVSADGMTVEKITVRWLSKSTGSDTAAGYEDLVLKPETDKVPNQQFQIDFSLSGKNEYEPGSVVLVFPAYLWLNRDGKEPGELTLSVPEEPETGADFAWRRVGNDIVITNTKRLSSASKILIQGSFRDVEAHTMRDVDTADKSLPYCGVSDAFRATVSVLTRSGELLEMTSNDIYAKLDTYADVSAATKTARNNISGEYNFYVNKPSTNLLPAALLPDDPEDYYYARWYVTGTAKGNQPYTMTVTDTIADEYGGIMLGIQGSAEGNVKSGDGRTVTAKLYSGYNNTVKSAYVWTAYPKTAFSEEGVTYTLHNSQTITVTGIDDEIDHTKTASATLPMKIPTTYHFIKKWDDNDNEKGRRPTSMTLNIYDYAVSQYSPWKTIRIEPDAEGNWTCSWDDEGKDRDFHLSETLHGGSGTTETYYDADGQYHYMSWNYYLKSSDWIDTTNTYIFENAYSEDWIRHDVSSFSKTANSYNYSNLMSTTDSALNRVLNGEAVEVPYSVGGTFAVSEKTVAESKTPVLITVEDDKYLLDGESVTTEDVEISGVTLSRPTVYAYTDLDSDTGYYKRETVTADQTVYLYGYVNGEWVRMATMVGGNVTAEDGSGASVSGGRVYLPSGVSKVKTEMETSEAVVRMSYTVYLKLKPSERILNLLEEIFEENDYAMFRLRNEARAYASYAGEEFFSMRDTATAFLHGRQYKVAVDLNKQFYFDTSRSGNDNDTVNRRIRLHSVITLTQQSNVLASNTYNEMLEDETFPNTRAGTFYDLLPPGVEPDLDSIELSAGDRVIEANVIPNYRGSGCTMLVVQVELTDHISYTSYRDSSRYYGNYPTEGYKNVHTMSYESYYPWENALDINLDKLGELRNVVAYEAAEASLGNIKTWAGEPDDPTAGRNNFSRAAVGDAAEYFTDLDKSRNDPAFAYAGANLETDEINVQAKTSLHKHVMAVGDPRWGTGSGDDAPVNVQEGGRYTYRLYIQSDADTTTTDIILLDSIENYVPKEKSDGEDYGAERWRGELVSVDVSQLESAGAAPVIYYSTVPELDLSQYNPEQEEGVVFERLQDTNVWSATPPEDLGEVTAIAIDASKRADGSKFELRANEIIIVYLHMMAPAEDAAEPYLTDDGMDPTLNAHAFNNVYLDGTQNPDRSASLSQRRDVNGAGTGGGQSGYHTYIHDDYTKLGIYTKAFDVTKVWDDTDDNDGMRPESVTVHLLADGVEVGTLVLNEDNDWHGTFEHLKTYNDDDSYISYTFTEDPIPGYELRVERDGDNVTLTNHHDLIQIEYPVTKVWTNDEATWDESRPASITVRLYADDVFTGRIMTIRTDSEGNWSGIFTGLNKFSDHGHEIVYRVEETPVTDYITTYDGGTITNRYYPYGDLTVEKTVENGTEAALGKSFTFTLELTDSTGEDVIDRYDYFITDSEGVRVGEGLIGNGGEFTLKDGQKLSVKDIPTKVHYRVTETATPGFTLTGSENAEGTIRSDRVSEAAFENAYHSVGTAQLSATKTLTGREMQSFQFQFRIENAEGVELARANNQQNGVVQFGQLRFTDADDGITYTYYVAETNLGRGGYTYDGTRYRVEITPHDNGDGTMTCEVKYFDGNGETAGISFANQYHASGSIQLRAWKALVGRTLESGEFSFELLDETGTVLKTTRNTADGDVVFDALTFDETDAGKTYLYVAREVVGTDATVVYDESLKGYEVKVVDNGDGTLSFTQSNVTVEAVTERNCATCHGSGEVEGVPCADCGGTGKVAASGFAKTGDDAETPLFQNGLADGSLSITKLTTWTAEDVPDADQEFTFQVRLVGDGVEDITGLNYHIDQVTNIGQQGGGSNPTPMKSRAKVSSIQPTTETVSHSGTLSDSVKWTLYADGTLIIEPTDGVSGTFNGWATYVLSNNIETCMTKWPWYPYHSQIKRVYVEGKVKATGHLSAMFRQCSNVTAIDVSNLDTSAVTNARSMFYECTSLEYLNIGNFDVSNIPSGNTDSYMGWFMSHNPNLSVVIIGEGFQFKGSDHTDQIGGPWKRFNNDEPSSYISWSSVVNRTGSSLTGIWVRQGYDYIGYYTVAFDANGGTGTMDSLDVMEGDSFTLPVCTFSGTNNAAFLGWSLTPDGAVLNYLDGQEVTDMDAETGDTITLYAVWGEPGKFTVVYRAPEGFGGSMARESYDPGKTITLTPNAFYRYDFHFDHWSGSDGETYADEATITTGAAGQMLLLTGVFERDPHGTDIADGTFELKLKAGQKITLTDLPAGVAYQVYEQTPGGWKLIEQTGVSGTIEPLETAEASFTNQYKPGTATAQIVGAKTLDGKAAEAGAFSFQLWEGETLLQTVSNQTGGFIQFDAIEYHLADVGTHTYTVKEVNGGRSDIAYDSHEETVTVTVAGDATALTATVAYAGGGGVQFANTTIPGALAITKVGEGLTDANRNTVFTFNVRLTNASGVPLEDGERTVQCKAGETVTIDNLPAGTRYTVTETDLPDGWTQTAEEGTTGTITAAATAQATITNTYSAKGYATITAHKQVVDGTLSAGEFSFELYDTATRYSHTANVSDAGVQSGKYSDNLGTRDVVTIPGAKSLHVELKVRTESGYDGVHIFRGVYTGEVSRNGSSGMLDTVSGTYDRSYDILGDTVTFGFYSDVSVTDFGYYAVITAATTETAVNGPIDTVTETTDEEGNIISNPWYNTAPVSFGAIEFTQPGDYTYYIREIAGSDSTVIYDDHKEEVKIHVTDNGDGTLNAEVTYDEDGALFTNRLKTGDLLITKTIQNATPKAAETDFDFHVTLRDASGNELTGSYEAEIINDHGWGEGRETVTKYAHSRNVSETGVRLGDYADNVNDDVMIVTIPGATQLHISIIVGTEWYKDCVRIYKGPISTNSGYVVNELSGPLEVGRTFTSEYDVDGFDTVSFRMWTNSSVHAGYYGYYAVITGEGDVTVETGEVAETITVSSGDTVSLRGGQTLHIHGLPNGTTYAVTEDNAEGWTQTAQTNATGTIRANDTVEATFENTYSTVGTVTLEAHKTLLGDELEAGQFQFQLLDEERNILETVSNEADGSITFSPMDYDQLDDGKTFLYYIVEVPGEEEDIVYDAHEERVLVTVADNGSGSMTVNVAFPSGETAEFTNARLHDLTVSKTVEGNLGDRTTRFPFTLSLTAYDGTAYTETVAAPEGVDWTAAGDGVYTFTLSHGDAFTLRIPGGVTYEITEAAPEDYETTVTITDADGGAVANAAEAPTAKGSMDGDRQVSFTNARGGVIPTAAETPSLPTVVGIGTLALVGLAVLYAVRRRRKNAR